MIKKAMLIMCLGLFSLAASSQKQSAKKEQVQEITFENKLVDGKKVWTPDHIEVAVGKKVKAKIVNTLPEPHGFEIPGIQGAMVIGPNETKEITFTPAQKGDYVVKCQMHPAHVPSKMTVK